MIAGRAEDREDLTGSGILSRSSISQLCATLGADHLDDPEYSDAVRTGPEVCGETADAVHPEVPEHR